MDRIDEELYQDFETEQAKAKRLAKEKKDMERLVKAAEKRGDSEAVVESKKKELQAKQRQAQAKNEKLFYKVTVRDNGMGMEHSQIPDMLGRVLSGTKYGVKQTRGKFGLGAKMALIWSKMSTGLPIEIYSARRGSKSKSYYKLDIDIRQNLPNVHESDLLPNPDGWHGAELSVTICGHWQYYRAKVLKYLQQIAVITPYAEFKFNFKGEGERNAFNTTFERRTSVMPPPPVATKHHPSSVDLESVKRLIHSTRYTKLSTFLCKEFDCVSKDLAERISDELGTGALADPSDLEEKDILRLHQLLHEVRFPDPNGRHLSPAGEYNLRLGVMKELRPEMVATYGGSVGVSEGHAFIVEAAVSIGGRDVKHGINVFRYANRIPLLFEGGSDVITRTALKRVNWGSYKINQSSDKVGVFVSVVSTKIPFKGAGKEYMADDVQSIQQAVKTAIQQCCLQLKQKIVRQHAAKEQKLRRKNLSKYIPNVAAAVHTVLKNIAERETTGATPAKRLREGNDFAAMLSNVRKGTVTQETLETKLQDHVEKIDTDMVRRFVFPDDIIAHYGTLFGRIFNVYPCLQTMEYQMQQGLNKGKRVDMYLVPKSARHKYEHELHNEVIVLNILQRFG